MFPPLQDVVLASSLKEMHFLWMGDVDDERWAEDFHQNIEKLHSKVKSLLGEAHEFSVSYGDVRRPSCKNIPGYAGSL